MHSASSEIIVFARLPARPGKQAEVRQAMLDPDEFYIHSRWRDMLLDHPFKATLSEQIW